MSAKKAAKKGAAKKAAKKSPKHHDKKHEGGKDLRRAYEHMGRLAALESTLPQTAKASIHTLTGLAQHSLTARDHKSAADLLRAGEHLAFGSVASTAKASKLSEELEAILIAEYEHLTDKADEHWEKHEDRRSLAIGVLYDMMLEAASVAYKKGAYRRALEFARGAEALAHVRGEEALIELEDGGKAKPRLKK
jgi:hypothetical protein